MKNVPDELLPALRGRSGELPDPGTSRWGKVARLATGTQVDQTNKKGRLTFVQTEVISNAPTPIAIKIRFSLDGLTYTPEVPATFGGNVIVDLIETIDMKSGAFRESFTLAPGEAMPICAVMACALNLSVSLDGEDAVLFVQVVAAPTTMIDCADVTPTPPPPSAPKLFSNTEITRHAAVIATPYTLGAVPGRGFLTVINQSAANLFIALGPGVVVTPGTEFATIILPPNVFPGYEVLNYEGNVVFEFDATDAAGFALVTQGFYV